MSEHGIQRELERVYRDDSRRILATLIRLLGDFDAAEEAMQDAFAVAVERWARDGVPENPRTWLISTARFREIDRMRRDARFTGHPERGEDLRFSPRNRRSSTTTKAASRTIAFA